MGTENDESESVVDTDGPPPPPPLPPPLPTSAEDEEWCAFEAFEGEGAASPDGGDEGVDDEDMDFADFVAASEGHDASSKHEGGGDDQVGLREPSESAHIGGGNIVTTHSDGASLEMSISASLSVSDGAEHPSQEAPSKDSSNDPNVSALSNPSREKDEDDAIIDHPADGASRKSDDEWDSNGGWETDQWSDGNGAAGAMPPPPSSPRAPPHSCPTTPATRRAERLSPSSPPATRVSSVPTSPVGLAATRSPLGSPRSPVVGESRGVSSPRGETRRRSRHLPPLGRASRVHSDGSVGGGAVVVPREIALSAPEIAEKRNGSDSDGDGNAPAPARSVSPMGSPEHGRRRRYRDQARRRERLGQTRPVAYDASALPEVTLETAVEAVTGAAAALREKIGRPPSTSSIRGFFYTPNDDRAKGHWSPRVDSGRKLSREDFDRRDIDRVAGLSPPDLDTATPHDQDQVVGGADSSLRVSGATIGVTEASGKGASLDDLCVHVDHQRGLPLSLHADASLDSSAVDKESTEETKAGSLEDRREYTQPLSSAPAAPVISKPSHEETKRSAQDSSGGAAGGVVDPCTEEERRLIESFWKVYDDTVILSLFAIVGIVFRIIAASFFSVFDDTFNSSSALFANLPLNCLSCFLLGVLCSGDDALKVVYTRMSVDRTGDNRRRESWRSAQDEMRDVQLQALERRMRKSSSLVLFPAKKEDVDVMEHYIDIFRGGTLQGGDLGGTNSGDEWEEWGEWQGDSFVNEGHERIAAEAARAHRAENEQQRSNKESSELGGFRVAEEGGDQAHHSQVDEEAVTMRAGEQMTESGCDPAEEMCGGSPSRSIDQGRRRRRIRRRRGRRRHRLLNQTDPNSPRDGFGVAGVGDIEKGVTDRRTDEFPHASDDDEYVSDRADATSRTDPANTRENMGTSPIGSQHRDAYSVGSDNFSSGVEHRDDRDLDQIFNDVTQTVTRLTRVNIADGWDVGTTPEAMSEDLLLGLRVGFCGCLSTFSSWNSSMIALLKDGHVTEAIVGYIIGLQLPIVSYRFGQHVAVYIFMWRVRRETRRAERRGGYGLRLRDSDDSDGSMDDEGDEANLSDEENTKPSVGDVGSFDAEGGPGARPRFYSDEDVGAIQQTSSHTAPRRRRRQRKKHGRILIEEQAGVAERETPSVRAIATALMLMTLVTLTTSIWFFDRPNQQKFAISLLFSPLGVLTRWKLIKYNHRRGASSFPLGTFACNMLGCALSGSLGSFLAGNPGPEESIVLVSIISGFGGSLSSLAAFVVEVLALIDPLLFKYDGVKYAFVTLFWAFSVGLITSQTRDWADEL